MAADGSSANQPASESLLRQLQLIRPGMTILFVDPDTVGVQRLADVLRGQHTVALVGSAADAMAQIGRHVPDLIITELDLPDADGLALVEQWRWAPSTRHTLLMIMTSRRSVLDKIAGWQAGADDYLIKPVEVSQFLAHIAAVSRFRRIIGGPLYH